MHLVIAFLTALASVLYALDKLGIDIGWLNPWAWKRRMRWLKQYHANPAFCLESPMESIALLLTATAKIDGDLSSEEKNELHQIFENTFNQTSKQASSLLASSSYLLGSGEEVFSRPSDVLVPSLETFSSEQKASSLELFSRISSVGGPPSESQLDFISRIKTILLPDQEKDGWQ